MAANHHHSPTLLQLQQQQQQQQQHQAHAAAHQQPPPPHPAALQQGAHYGASHPVAQVNEAVWLQIGSFSELLRVPDEAMHAYERALQANPNSTAAMNAIGMLLKGREAYEKALEFFRAIVQLEPTNGEAWGNLGQCYLMSENLQKAYDAYQQALVNLRDAKDPMLWYGIGILYDRYGSYDYAEEAFSQVMQIQPDFEKANEIYFRLGIIYKQQSKFANSLECFKYIVNSPPAPLSQDDIWFQIGHVHEQQKEFDAAKNAYNRVLENTPNHAKVLQQLGWLHHQQSNAYDVQERAIQYLEKSVGADNQDAQSWYLLGRCYMSQQKYPKAYEAYQQAVYRDGRNPTFWCSIGVLYYQINQYRDALDAYSRAIRLNPYISEVWYDLGTLYESCNNQITDALDAYQRAAELDPTNPHIKARLQLLRSGASNGGPPPTAPQPADVHPQAYQAAGPVGPNWNNAVQQPASNGPPHTPQGTPAGENWAGRLSNVNPPPQPPNPFGNEPPAAAAPPADSYRGQPPLGPQRQPTPLQDVRQGYPEPSRSAAAARRVQSPAPAAHYAQPPPPAQAPPPHAVAPEGRVVNPNWSGATPSAAAPPSHSAGAGIVDGATPFRAANSPRLEGRIIIHDTRMPSPKSAYPPQSAYAPQPEAPPPQAVVEASLPPPPPPPPAAVVAPEVAAPRVDERPGSTGPKRLREWEEESSAKKQANEENRARLEDMHHRRPSTPPRDGGFRRNSGSDLRRSDERRRSDEAKRSVVAAANEEPPRHPREGYHPSEAAHHQHNHSSSTSQPPPIPAPTGVPSAPGSTTGNSLDKTVSAAATPKEERANPADHAATAVSGTPVPANAAPAPPGEPERAARKMDVDDDYDDSGEDEKKASLAKVSAGVKIESETSPAAAGAVNGSATAVPKAE